MLNMAGPMDGLDQEMVGKSAFMELQQQMPPGMGHPAYQIRTGYPPQHGHDGAYTSQATRSLGYPFSMNSMAPTSYNPPPTHFSMSPYQTPSPPRDGKSYQR